MSSDDIIRAWKDPDQRQGDWAGEHPAGEIALDHVGGSSLDQGETLYCTVYPEFCPRRSYLVACPV